MPFRVEPAPSFRDGAAVSVVLASAGYPASSSKGDVITGVGAANGVNDVDVIHAGTALITSDSGDRQLVTAGGRVLAVRALGYDIDDARSRETGGAGLGLAIARSIALAHGGAITLESAAKAGSLFTVHLPAA